MASIIPENAALLTGQEIATATQASFGDTALARVQFKGVTTDSRASLRGKLFVALRGENYDGHAYVQQALKAGAAGVLVEQRSQVESSERVFYVEDTLTALGELAKFHRTRWKGQIIAVAGSAGKTTTRSAIHRVLAQVLSAGSVWSPAGNLNNQIGVPMVLLALTSAHQVAVVEIGTNAVGEVSQLCRLTSPDIGVLTLIDLEHTEGLGDLAGVEAEEGALFQGLSPSAIAVGNADDERVFRQLRNARAETKLSYGTVAGADYRIVERQVLKDGRSLVGVERTLPGLERETVRFRSSLPGRAGALGAAGALAVSELTLGRRLTSSELENALETGVGEEGRLRPIELQDGSLLIDDSYNSNPASLFSSVECAEELAHARNARLILVMGEMRELGSLAATEHERVGRRLAASRAQYLVAVGGEARRFLGATQTNAFKSDFAETALDALGLLKQELQAGDVILVKASRGVRAEQVVEGLIQAKGRAQ